MAIVFLKFQPQNSQIRHFWSQFQAFLLFHDILLLDKFKGAGFKYDNSLKKKKIAQKNPNTAFLVKNSQMRLFGPKFKHFCFFTNICNQANLKVLISNMTIMFSIPTQKYPNQAFWSKFRNIGFFREIWQKDKFEGADFKYHNSFIKVLAQK